MLVQWLTFSIMILIQAVAAVWCVSAIRTTLSAQGQEIQSLRDWRHKVAPKEMLVETHADQLKDHEARIRNVEARHIVAKACPVEDCPFKKALE